ncbi:hypothetical protein [Laspinema palackyanum]|nr:hypothetical protein [Laspinema sp. D2c]
MQKLCPSLEGKFLGLETGVLAMIWGEVAEFGADSRFLTWGLETGGEIW